jgi:hypothetical protein
MEAVIFRLPLHCGGSIDTAPNRVNERNALQLGHLRPVVARPASLPIGVSSGNDPRLRKSAQGLSGKDM